MTDSTLEELEIEETKRLNDGIELIASENYPSQDILDLLGSHFSVKYAEGFPKKISKQGRHYAGCEVIDKLEEYTIEKACELFECNYANVQPHSGSQANQAVYSGLLKPGDTVLGMGLEYGGHLTHFSKASSTGSIYNAFYYGLDENGELNYDEIKEKLEKHHPRLLVVGASAYSKRIDYERIRKIVDEYNENLRNEYEIRARNSEGGYEAVIDWYLDDEYKCYLMSDSAHVMGFIAAHLWKDKYNPLKWCDVVTSTTHKTLRGPRGGIILWNDKNLCSKLNSGVFPKIQGGPNEALVAAKCQCFIEALRPSFRDYMEQVYINMQALINGIKKEDTEEKIKFIGGGSENHMVLINLRDTGINGKQAEDLLTSYDIICNKNMMIGDSKPSKSSAIRVGTAAITTRGFDENMCYELGRIMARILLRKKNVVENGVVDFEEQSIRPRLKKMLEKVGPFYKVEKQSAINVVDFNPSDDPA